MTIMTSISAQILHNYSHAFFHFRTRTFICRNTIYDILISDHSRTHSYISINSEIRKITRNISIRRTDLGERSRRFFEAAILRFSLVEMAFSPWSQLLYVIFMHKYVYISLTIKQHKSIEIWNMMMTYSRTNQTFVIFRDEKRWAVKTTESTRNILDSSTASVDHREFLHEFMAK